MYLLAIELIEDLVGKDANGRRKVGPHGGGVQQVL
jgi:hypothetical protein